MAQRARERVVAVAAQLVSEVGWNGLTMARIADRAGVSRQTVYNAVESKQQLANLVVRREFEEFLNRVETALEPHAVDPVAAVEAGVLATLKQPPDLHLLGSLTATLGGSQEDWFALLVDQHAALLHRATRMADRQLARFDLDVADDVRRSAADVIVRASVTHALAPDDPPEQVARELASVAAMILGLPVPEHFATEDSARD